MKSIIFLSTAILFLSGCDSINRVGLTSDLKALFKNHDVKMLNIKCQMIEKSRAGYCSGVISIADTLKLIETMKLSRFGKTPIEASKLDLSPIEFDGGCRINDYFKDDQNINIYWNNKRPKQLRLNSGVAFEYLLLFQRRDGKEACVQISYSYG